MKLGMPVGLGPGHIVLDGDQLPSPKEAQHPNLWLAHICSGQMAGRIKMSLSMQLGLDPRVIVLDGNPAPLPKKGAELFPNFQPMFIVAKRLDGSRCQLVWK